MDSIAAPPLMGNECLKILSLCYNNKLEGGQNGSVRPVTIFPW